MTVDVLNQSQATNCEVWSGVHGLFIYGWPRGYSRPVFWLVLCECELALATAPMFALYRYCMYSGNRSMKHRFSRTGWPESLYISSAVSDFPTHSICTMMSCCMFNISLGSLGCAKFSPHPTQLDKHLVWAAPGFDRLWLHPMPAHCLNTTLGAPKNYSGVVCRMG